MRRAFSMITLTFVLRKWIKTQFRILCVCSVWNMIMCSWRNPFRFLYNKVLHIWTVIIFWTPACGYGWLFWNFNQCEWKWLGHLSTQGSITPLWPPCNRLFGCWLRPGYLSIILDGLSMMKLVFERIIYHLSNNMYVPCILGELECNCKMQM